MNHYYLYNLLASTPDLPVRNHWFRDGDPGNLVLAAGVGIVASTREGDGGAALRRLPAVEDGPADDRARPGRGRVPAREGRAAPAGAPPAELDQGPEVQPRAPRPPTSRLRCGSSSRRASSGDLGGAAVAILAAAARRWLLVSCGGARRSRGGRPDRVPRASSALGRRARSCAHTARVHARPRLGHGPPRVRRRRRHAPRRRPVRLARRAHRSPRTARAGAWPRRFRS